MACPELRPCKAGRGAVAGPCLHDGEEVVQDARLQLEPGLVERVCSAAGRVANAQWVGPGRERGQGGCLTHGRAGCRTHGTLHLRPAFNTGCAHPAYSADHAAHCWSGGAPPAHTPAATAEQTTLLHSAARMAPRHVPAQPASRAPSRRPPAMDAYASRTTHPP